MVDRIDISTQPYTRNFTLAEAYQSFSGDPQHSIPLPVWLLENPDSPLSFPGQIYLREHDYLHILLDRGISPEDEAFVVGFTMGNDPSISAHHLSVFKFAARLIYPKPYRFTTLHLVLFECGVRFGRRAPVKYLNSLDYSPYLNWDIVELRQHLGIDMYSIQELLGFSTDRPWLSNVAIPDITTDVVIAA